MSNGQVSITAESDCVDKANSKADAHHCRARQRSIERLPNHRVLSELLNLNRQQRHFEADLLLFLGELDRRQLYREQAVSSAFAFCVERLGYSEDVAYKRVGAARLLRQLPAIFDWIADGRVHLTALMLIKPQLTEDNHEQWLSLVCGKSKRQVEHLVASRCPRPGVPSSIRKLPAPKPEPVSVELLAVAAATTTTDDAAARSATTTTTRAANDDAATRSMTATSTTAATAQPIAQPKATLPPQLTPLSGSTYRVTFTAGERLKLKLDRARELLSHCVNPTDLPALFERALDELLDHEEKRRYGVAQRVASKARARELRSQESSSTPASQTLARHVPSNPSTLTASAEPQHEVCHKPTSQLDGTQDPDPDRVGPPTSLPREQLDLPAKPRQCDDAPPCSIGRKRRRSIPRGVRRAVFERDAGQCTYFDARGRRCQERCRLELDHIEAYALGGPDTVGNMRLRCKHHNRLAAEQLFGRAQVAGAIRHARVRLPAQTSR